MRGIGRGGIIAARGTQRMGTVARGAGAGIAGTTAAASGLAYVVGKRSVTAFNEAATVQRDQQAALKSTGAQAWITGGQLNTLATAQSRRTGIDDEAIGTAQTTLLTFAKIRNSAGKNNNVFDQSSQAVLDLSARFKKGLGPSAVMVGKALNDPAKGLTALQRVGVGFTAQQAEQIKVLSKGGNTLKAQRIILRELEKQTGGSAAAQGTALMKWKVASENVQESIGGGLAPVVDMTLAKMTNFAQKSEPLVGKASRDVARIMGRKDLTGDQKLTLGLKVARADLKPITRDLEQMIDRARLGDKLGDAVEAGAPRMADAMAAAVPRMAGAFGNAFMNAGPGGQLLTGAMLAAKLGAFPLVGRMMAGRFSRNFGRTMATSPVLASAGRTAGRRVATSAAASTATVLPAQISRRGGALKAAGTSAGVVVGTSAGKAVASKTAQTAAGGMRGRFGAASGLLRGAGRMMGGTIGTVAATIITGKILDKLANGDIKGAIENVLNPLDFGQGDRPGNLGEPYRPPPGAAPYRPDAGPLRRTPPTPFSETRPAPGSGPAPRRTDGTDRQRPGTSVRTRATGGIVRPGEVTLVGERGPELARFPARTEIVTATQTRGILARPPRRLLTSPEPLGVLARPAVRSIQARDGEARDAALTRRPAAAPAQRRERAPGRLAPAPERPIVINLTTNLAGRAVHHEVLRVERDLAERE
ncbi:MAG: hypothetical protein WKF94_17220 [Solirubrobacteraceae bacterium]